MIIRQPTFLVTVFRLPGNLQRRLCIMGRRDPARSIAQLAKKAGRVTREELEATLSLSPDKYSQWRSARGDFFPTSPQSAEEKMTSVVIDDVEHEGYCNEQEITVRFTENVCMTAQTMRRASGIHYKPMEGRWAAPPDGPARFSPAPFALTYMVRETNLKMTRAR
jgi:hypothetical protein